jgi:[NiFe] hydrogenase assembly HybE family chaperone
MLQGVLVTPWFMNLVRLPLRNAPATGPVLAERQKATRPFGNTDFEFIGSFEARIGAFEVCSLYSPMFEFADHAAALATAQEVLNQLHRPAPEPAPTAHQLCQADAVSCWAAARVVRQAPSHERLWRIDWQLYAASGGRLSASPAIARCWARVC